jgi:hypothetical protein
MTTIGLLGDTHMDWIATRDAIGRFAEAGISKVIQVGDFGFYGHEMGQSFLDLVDRHLMRNGMAFYITPGNHEDYGYLETLTETTDDGWIICRPGILVTPRGHRWEWESRSFVSLGGAPSVDRQWRVAAQTADHRYWWSQEAITREDVDQVKAGGYADVMIGHDAPIIPEIDDRIRSNPHGFAEEDLIYADQGRKLYHEAARAVMPKLLFAGHYHFPVDTIKHWASMDTGYFSTRDIVGTSRVIVLDCNGHSHSLATLDLETLEPKVWDR